LFYFWVYLIFFTLFFLIIFHIYKYFTKKVTLWENKKNIRKKVLHFGLLQFGVIHFTEKIHSIWCKTVLFPKYKLSQSVRLSQSEILSQSVTLDPPHFGKSFFDKSVTLWATKFGVKHCIRFSDIRKFGVRSNAPVFRNHLANSRGLLLGLKATKN